MREAIKLFVRDLELIRTIEKNNGISISELSRILSIPYSTVYVKVHRLEKAGLLNLNYKSGRKTINLTEMAKELIEALEIIEKSNKSNHTSLTQQLLDDNPSDISQEHHL